MKCLVDSVITFSCIRHIKLQEVKKNGHGVVLGSVCKVQYCFSFSSDCIFCRLLLHQCFHTDNNLLSWRVYDNYFI